MLQHDDVARNEVAQKLGSAENVFRLLECHWIVSHTDGGLGVGVDDACNSDEDVEIREKLAHKNDVTSGQMAPKNSASALLRVTERCIFENQWKRQPW